MPKKDNFKESESLIDEPVRKYRPEELQAFLNMLKTQTKPVPVAESYEQAI